MGWVNKLFLLVVMGLIIIIIGLELVSNVVDMVGFLVGGSNI